MEIHICSITEYDAETRMPTIVNPDSSTFYLVPTEDGTSPNLFTEWVYVNGAWEMFGSASVDLSGYLTDVQINGTSIVTDGVANVPIANNTTLGAVKSRVGDNGIQILSGGFIGTYVATDNDVKGGIQPYRPVAPNRQHASAFYGLAKSAGDTTQSQSSNAVGNYTEDAKIAIQKMLGIYEAPWELIREDTFTNAEEADHIIDVDANGEPFELSDLILILWVPSQDNTAIIGDVGRVFFRNGNTNIRCVYLNAISVPANSTIRVAIAILTQNNGLMSANYVEWATRSSHQNIRVTNIEDKNGYGTPFGLNDTPINSISINAVTGTMGYRLLGKRKWQ